MVKFPSFSVLFAKHMKGTWTEHSSESGKNMQYYSFSAMLQELNVNLYYVHFST